LNNDREKELAEEQKTTLSAFAQALQREVHVLQDRPDLLWQQLYNRLQWEDEPITRLLIPEIEHRCKPGAEPWLKNQIPPRESKALIRTLAGHRGPINACAISPDGSWIVSASEYRKLKVWDVTTGIERASLTGHTGRVRTCAISPDGSWIVSASDDNTLKVWDAATGSERATLTGHTGWVNTCAISPDGSIIVSASMDETLKVWDSDCAKEHFTLMGHNDHVTKCEISPDGKLIVSISDDKTLMVWDAITGNKQTCLPLAGHPRSLALHPYLPQAICGDVGGNLYILEFIDIEYGPLIITAVITGSETILRCPACQTNFSLQMEWLDKVITCPQPDCRHQLKVNPFITRMT
jgi:WD40 repeat protein